MSKKHIYTGSTSTSNRYIFCIKNTKYDIIYFFLTGERIHIEIRESIFYTFNHVKRRNH
jgi:hypothetical protein